MNKLVVFFYFSVGNRKTSLFAGLDFCKHITRSIPYPVPLFSTINQRDGSLIEKQMLESKEK